MTINFNGKTYHSFEEMLAAEKDCNNVHVIGHASNVVIRNGVTIVDGVPIKYLEGGCVTHIIIQGDVQNVTTTSGDVSVCGSVGSINCTSGDVDCGDVIGSVNTTSGDVNCGSVGGMVNTYSGNIRHR